MKELRGWSFVEIIYVDSEISKNSETVSSGPKGNDSELGAKILASS